MGKYRSENEYGEVIGTTTAWYGKFQDDETWGRIHWVAVKPDYQKTRKTIIEFSYANIVQLSQKGIFNHSNDKLSGYQFVFELWF